MTRMADSDSCVYMVQLGLVTGLFSFFIEFPQPNPLFQKATTAAFFTLGFLFASAVILVPFRNIFQGSPTWEQGLPLDLGFVLDAIAAVTHEGASS